MTINSRKKISVLIPVMNEVESLNTTIEIIVRESPMVEFEFIIVLSPSSTNTAIANAYSIQASKEIDCSVFIQKYPGLGGAYAHAIEMAEGEKILMIASDLETDPILVKSMIEESKRFPKAIITTTRWTGDSAGFQSYGTVKKVLNFGFQKWIAFMYKSELSDFTFGFRLYPSAALKGVKWQSNNFAFLLESILVPLKRGFSAVEIPHYWRPRQEGVSNNRKSFFFDYFRVAIKVWRS